MGRTKVQKRKKGTHSSKNMLRAIMLYRNGSSLRKAADECNLCYPTLQRYAKKYKALSDTQLQSLKLTPNYDVNRVFTDEQEEALKAYIKDCAYKFYGLTSKDTRRVAYQMAIINEIPVPNNWNRDQMAGEEWLRTFRSRNPDLSLKKPEACSLGRATAFNRSTIKKYFENLRNVIDRHPSFGTGCRIFNLDETGTTTVQKPQRVMAPKGRQNIAKVTSGEKGTLVTTCAIVCATGYALPPVLVFPRKNFKDHMMFGAPAASLGLASPSGWMTSNLFVEVIKHFIKHTSASPENPALLIMDNHESHLSIEALDLAKQSGVTILTLHPHTTAKTQPLDVGLNGPFKTFYNAAIDSWLMKNPGKQLTIYNIAECVGQAYPKAMTPVNITSAFKKCGIFPYDENVFTDIDFMPSEVTDREQPARATAASPDSGTTYCSGGAGSPSIFDLKDSQFEEMEHLNTQHDKTPEKTKKEEMQEDFTTRDDFNSTPVNPIEMEKKVSFLSPNEFMPKLKSGPRTGNRKPRKLGKSMIATDTPEKSQIAEERRKTQERKSRARKIMRPILIAKKSDNEQRKIKKKMKIKRTKQDVESETSEDETVTICLSDSDGIISENEELEEEDFIVINGNFEELRRQPEANDYVLILFNTKKLKVYYFALILEQITRETYVVSFMRVKSKNVMKFIMPLEPDMAEVKVDDIKMILPQPKIQGSKSRSSFYSFPVRMSPNLHLR